MSATTPLYSGKASVAYRLHNPTGIQRQLLIGDSKTAGMTNAWPRQLAMEGKLGGVGGMLNLNSLTNASVWTATNTDTTFKSLNMSSTFAGGTLSAGGNPLATRMFTGSLYVPGVGVINLVNSYGPDVINAWLVAGKTVRVYMIVYAQASGNTANSCYLQIRKTGSGTQLAQGASFNGFAASPIGRLVSVDIPPALANGGPFDVDVCFTDGATGESGKVLYLCSALFAEFVGSNGVSAFNFGIGGSSIDTWNDGSLVGAPWYACMTAFNPTSVFIALGTNNPNLNTSAQHTTKMQTLMTTLRASMPSADLEIVSMDATGAAVGGEEGEAYNVSGNANAAATFSGCLHVNMQRWLEPYEYVWSVTQYPNSSGDWSTVTTGYLFPKGCCVVSSGIMYAAKADVAKGATAPASDAANWASLGATAVVYADTTVGQTLNPGLQDGVHRTYRGYDLWCRAYREAHRQIAAMSVAGSGGIFYAGRP